MVSGLPAATPCKPGVSDRYWVKTFFSTNYKDLLTGTNQRKSQYFGENVETSSRTKKDFPVFWLEIIRSRYQPGVPWSNVPCYLWWAKSFLPDQKLWPSGPGVWWLQWREWLAVADPGMGQGRTKEWAVRWGIQRGKLGETFPFFTKRIGYHVRRECQKIIKKPKRRSRFLLSECTQGMGLGILWFASLVLCCYGILGKLAPLLNAAYDAS